MKDDLIYLQHVADSIAKIRAYTRGGEQAFFRDTIIQDAVIRNLEIVGEAVKRLSEVSKAKRPETPCREIAGMRDVLIHNYFGVKLDRVWHVIERDLLPLEAAIMALIADANVLPDSSTRSTKTKTAD
jgi:uncharacterized protein with HEPN domain